MVPQNGRHSVAMKGHMTCDISVDSPMANNSNWGANILWRGIPTGAGHFGARRNDRIFAQNKVVSAQPIQSIPRNPFRAKLLNFESI